jgi:hypothetical protein
VREDARVVPRSKQPRRCAGRRAGAHRRGKGPRQAPPPSSTDLDPVNAQRLRLRLGATSSTTDLYLNQSLERRLL